MPEIKAIIFDLDGVLMDSSPIHAAAFEELLSKESVFDFKYSEIAGMTTRGAFEKIFQKRNIPISELKLEELCKKKRDLAHAELLCKKPFDPDSYQVIEQLSALMPVGLATSASRRTVEFFLGETQLEPFLSSVMLGENVAYAKPAPDIFLECARSLKIEPHKTLVVEDSYNGILAGLRGGFPVLVRRGTLDSIPTDSGIVGSIDNLQEIFNFVWSSQIDSSLSVEALPLEAEKYTAILPIAGLGSRLGISGPKALYRIAGRPLLFWILDLVAKFSTKILLVVSPKSKPEIEGAIRSLEYYERIQLVIQPEPKGMADAIHVAKEKVQTTHCLVVWGDQIGLSEQTLSKCVRLHSSRPNARLTFPTSVVQDPYIWIKRNESGNLVEVAQAREGEIKINVGENDCGFFVFQSETLFKILAQSRKEGLGIGPRTGEYNLLPLLPMFEMGPGACVTLVRVSKEETYGVNTPDEAERATLLVNQRWKDQVIK